MYHSKHILHLLITYLVESRTKHRTADACSCSFFCMAPEGLEP